MSRSKIKEDPEKNRSLWKARWRQARDNMPSRAVTKTQREWVPCRPNSVPIPSFIQGQAEGKYKMENGKLLEQKEIKHTFYFGKERLLLKLIGQLGKGMQSVGKVANAIRTGVIPRDPWTRSMLITLAGPEGNKIAWEKLKKDKRAHLYKDRVSAAP